MKKVAFFIFFLCILSVLLFYYEGPFSFFAFLDGAEEARNKTEEEIPALYEDIEELKQRRQNLLKEKETLEQHLEEVRQRIQRLNSF